MTEPKFPDVLMIFGIRHNAMFVATLLLNAKTVVELGTGQGTSGDMFVKAMKVTGGRVYSVDINPNCTGRDLLKDEKCITLIVGDSIELGRKWDKGNIDVLYCDSDHSYQHVKNELEIWGKYNPKVIFIHDTGGPSPAKHPHGHPFRAAKEYAAKTGRLFINLLTPEGLGIII